MQVARMIPILTLCLTGSFAAAKDVNCSAISDPQARQECAKHKTANNADCSAISDPQARKECAEAQTGEHRGLHQARNRAGPPAVCKAEVELRTTL